MLMLPFGKVAGCGLAAFCIVLDSMSSENELHKVTDEAAKGKFDKMLETLGDITCGGTGGITPLSAASLFSRPVKEGWHHSAYTSLMVGRQSNSFRIRAHVSLSDT